MSESSGPDAVDLGEIRDELPADLDPSQVTEPYLFPNNSRRKIPAVLYVIIGVAGVVLWQAAGGDNVLINTGLGLASMALVIIGLYHWQAGFDLAFDEEHALAAAGEAAGFPVGHASAQLGWRGLRSRPTWRILLYSNEVVPLKRGLALVDGVDGEIIDRFVEDNPEDWAAYTDA